MCEQWHLKVVLLDSVNLLLRQQKPHELPARVAELTSTTAVKKTEQWSSQKEDVGVENIIDWQGFFKIQPPRHQYDSMCILSWLPTLHLN
jgi:hypothetical protein